MQTEKDRAQRGRIAWNELVGKLQADILFNPTAHALKSCAETIFGLYEVATAGSEQRSTPTYIADCAEATDFRGKVWRYSEPSDTWCVVLEHGEGVANTSARSWQKLNYVYGPITLKDG